MGNCFQDSADQSACDTADTGSNCTFFPRQRICLVCGAAADKAVNDSRNAYCEAETDQPRGKILQQLLRPGDPRLLSKQ